MPDTFPGPVTGMNLIAPLLTPDTTLLDLSFTSKKKLFEHAAELFAQTYGLKAPDIFTSLFDRERLGSTALGYGIAIPHGRIKGLKAPMAAVLQLAHPIGFDAPDEQAVSLLIFLLVPEAATQKHLEILSEIAEMLSDGGLREKLAASASAADLHDLIAKWQSAQVA